MKIRQILCIILALSCIFSGCSQNSSEDSPTLKGRYMEKNISLPEEIADSTLSLTKKDDKPLLFVYHENPNTITAYALNQNGSWEDATPAWLQTITDLQEGWSYQPQFFEDANGFQYFFYEELIDDNFHAYLLCSKDGTTYQEIQPEGWNSIDPEYGAVKAPSKITIMADGTIAALFYSGEVRLYDAENQKHIQSISDQKYNNDFICSSGKKVILSENNSNIRVKGVTLYNLSDSSSTSYPFSTEIDSYVYCDANDQDIFLCNADGIFKLESDTSVWNCVLDGTLTSLAMPSLWSNAFISDASGNYYVLFSSESGYKLMQYYYDETVNTLPSTELNIYSLTDNSLLRQAAALFQQNHTDVKVTLTTVMTQDEYSSCDIATLDDYIRALNTELLAGNHYDILVLDGLPADSFIEKGVLTDLSDILQPMIEDGTLPENILNCYRHGNKIYQIPARFGINILMGASADAAKLNDLDALTEYVKENPASSLFGIFTLNDLIDTFLPYQMDSIYNEKGEIDRDSLIHALDTLKLLTGENGITDNYNNTEYRANSMWNLTLGDYLYLDNTKSFLDAMYSLGIQDYAKGSYTSFETSFTPSSELGIVSKGQQLDLSRDFIRTVLSEEVQNNDFYDGFPINTKALKENSLKDRSQYSACSSVENEDGTYDELNFYPINDQQTKALVNYCSVADTKILSDRQLASAIKTKAKDFFSGNQSSSDAADAVIEAMKVYLAE